MTGLKVRRTPLHPSSMEVVSGHAYAVLAPEVVSGGWCGYDKPTNLSVDGVSDPLTLGPGAKCAGALDVRWLDLEVASIGR